MRTLTALLTAILLVLSSPLYTQNDFKLGFTGAYPNQYLYTLSSGTNWAWYNELNVNTWQGWCVGGNNRRMEEPTLFVLGNLANENNMTGWLQPDTIRWAGYGRVQVNEAEDDGGIRFGYNNHHNMGMPETDDWQSTSQRVQKYTAPSSPGLVLTGVNENGFQSFSGHPYDPVYQHRFPYNNYNDTSSMNPVSYINNYYVKPRMRVNANDVNNAPDKRVVRIIVNKFNGLPADTMTIFTSDFKNSQGTYDGRYLEDYFIHNFLVRGDVLNAIGDPKGRGENFHDYDTACHVDYQIYWYGEVSVWIDYVKVMDEAAYRLFHPDPLFNINDEIQEKINFIKTHDAGGKMKGFYMEEIDYSNLTCLKYLNDSMPGWASDEDYKVIGLINPWSYQRHLKPGDNLIGEYIDKVNPPFFMLAWYPFFGNYTEYHPRLPKYTTFDTFPSHTPQIVIDEIRTKYTNYIASSNEQYNNYLQMYILNRTSDTMRFFNTLCNSKGKKFIVSPQIHNYQEGAGDPGLREPMNAEIGATFCIDLCNGAKGLVPYFYEAYFYQVSSLIRHGGGIMNRITGDLSAGYNYSYGMTDVDKNDADKWGRHKREKNFYNENKWDYVKTLYNKIETWGPVLYNSTNTQGFSVHNEGAGHEFISDILSIDPHRIGPNNCLNDNGLSQQYADFVECPEERYWEMGIFNTSEPDTKYFMVVNRRCVPAGGGYAGDDRVLRVKFNITSGPVNWQISEVGGSTRPKVFSRSYQGYVDIGVSSNSGMGWFKPGEGKLFKVQPALRTGGELVEDEIINGGEFTCEAPVYNNGHNITIGANTTIHFNDSSKFVLSGGVFTVGDQNTSAPQNITSDAVPGGSWRGHSFTNCEVKIYGATFSGLANDTTYAVNIIDCPVVDIRNCTFNTNSSLKGGINAICFNNPFIAINNIYIGSNTFNSSGSTIPTVNVSSYAGVTTPLIIENNTFNEGNTAVFLSDVIGGAIKGNTITDNYIGINALTSSIDVVQNTISSTVNGSMGIFAAGGSELKLNSSGAFTLGGLNNISNEGTGINNINVDGSYFLLDDGENIFNISSDQSSYHLYGYFPMFTAVTTEETNNCFKVNSSPVDPPVNMVTSGYQGTQITFNFIPYLAGCEIIGGGDGLAINLGDGIYDTIYTGGSGSGGSQSSVASVRRTDKQAYVASNAKTIYDSICVLMRYRNYTQAKTKCLDLINTYPDSIQSIFAVSKLFLATVASDTSYNAVNTLKIFYENLILNHPGNTSLVKRANYYILKCKVRMREYSQALLGFQQIINQNPYSYEGLIARWDYMATSLLVQGQGGAFSSIDNEQLTMNNYDIDGNDDDEKPFTKEQRQDIRKSINTAIEISKNDDETKIKKLEEKSELGDVNASKELTQMKSLKQVVKTEKPKSIIEHVRIVSEDIRRVFGSNTSSKGNEPKNIPLVFRISQNYPNPFNPVTKINYDLPRDSKVKIVIYDILGREVNRLVNNELKTAGSYIVDFNASNYASGVYFYRIEAEESNGNKFVDSKKMVLLK